MNHGLLIVLIFLILKFSNIFCSSFSVPISQINTYNLATISYNYHISHNQIRSKTMEKSDYYKVRAILSASELVDQIVDEFSIVSSTPLGLFTKIATNVTKFAIYAEDWRHTDKEIERRINEVLNSEKLANAADYPELYTKFEKYVNTSLKSWIPDRDYPKIGYLPKKLLYDQSLGEKEITKYWPEATKENQAKYVALTLDELVLNYELVWNDLHQNKKIP